LVFGDRDVKHERGDAARKNDPPRCSKRRTSLRIPNGTGEAERARSSAAIEFPKLSLSSTKSAWLTNSSTDLETWSNAIQDWRRSRGSREHQKGH
jgi:hypothetical protein